MGEPAERDWRLDDLETIDPKTHVLGSGELCGFVEAMRLEINDIIRGNRFLVGMLAEIVIEDSVLADGIDFHNFVMNCGIFEYSFDRELVVDVLRKIRKIYRKNDYFNDVYEISANFMLEGLFGDPYIPVRGLLEDKTFASKHKDVLYEYFDDYEVAGRIGVTIGNIWDEVSDVLTEGFVDLFAKHPELLLEMKNFEQYLSGRNKLDATRKILKLNELLKDKKFLELLMNSDLDTAVTLFRERIDTIKEAT